MLLLISMLIRCLVSSFNLWDKSQSKAKYILLFISMLIRCLISSFDLWDKSQSYFLIKRRKGIKRARCTGLKARFSKLFLSSVFVLKIYINMVPWIVKPTPHPWIVGVPNTKIFSHRVIWYPILIAQDLLAFFREKHKVK